MRTPASTQRTGVWLPATCVAALAGIALATGITSRIDRAVTDAQLRATVDSPPNLATGAPDVAVVAVDPRSLRAYPDWPWPRSHYARAVNALDRAGARAIAFDIDFSTPRDPDHDRAFAEAMEESGRVALAAFRQVQRLPGGGDLEIFNLPAEGLADRAAAVGSVLAAADADGVVRRAPRASSIAARSMPSLALAAIAIAEEGAPPRVEPSTFRIDYRRSKPDFPTLSILDVIEGRFDPRDVAGRIVFIGATAAEFQDLWTTPLEPLVPGVVIQAIGARTLMAEAAGEAVLRPAPLAAELAAIALLSLAMALLGRLENRWRVIGLLTAAAGVLLTSMWLVQVWGITTAPHILLGVIAAHYVLGIESVRDRFSRRLSRHRSTLQALSQVGAATTRGGEAALSARDGASLAISLLGQVTQASAVVWFRAEGDGRIGEARLDWRPEDPLEPEACGDVEIARGVQEVGTPRRFQEAMPSPGGADRPGSAVYTPLVAHDTRHGVLVVERAGEEPFDEAELRTIATAAAQLALSARNQRLLEDLRQTFSSSMAAVAAAIEARDGYTELHCRRLAAFSCTVAARLGLPADEIKAIELGALLHDVGKIGIRDVVLNKPGRFDAEERALMEEHPDIGSRIVGAVHGLSETTLHCIRHHHERWDGTGYPDRLAGEDIPLAARIVAVVDVWDALSSRRPYKEALPQDRVLDMLRKGRGEHFDPRIVDLFLEVLEEQGEEMLAVIDRDCPGSEA